MKETAFAVSVCDRNGILTYMNEKSAVLLEKDGGFNLLGRNIFDCHPEPSRSRLKEMMETGETQSYYKGEGESKRLIHQTPVYKDGEFDGFIEIIIPLPGL